MEFSTPSLPVRSAAESRSEMTELILPNDANTLGNLLGGRLMHFIDLVGAMAAYRHSRSHVVTASMDHIDFIAPVHVGDLLILKSSVNRAYRTSMEVGVKVFVENMVAGMHRHVASAYLTSIRRAARSPSPAWSRRAMKRSADTKTPAGVAPHASTNRHAGKQAPRWPRNSSTSKRRKI
jgi:acyl-CoA hydrolase